MYAFIFRGLYPVKGVGILKTIINIKTKVKSITQIFFLYQALLNSYIILLYNVYLFSKEL